MTTTTPSLILYDASAGSGKTFTLVKEYLIKLLLAENTDYYKQILAITFTNKAVGEMKQRIVEQLVAFAKEDSKENPGDMQKLLAEEIHQSHAVIQEKSKRILRHLLHDYSGFSVETIDKFNHRIIRTFAKDLKLNSNFEVSLDSDPLLEEAVDRLIAKAGEDKAVTEYLLDYTFGQLYQDKSWNIRRAIFESSKLLHSETNKNSLDTLKHHDLEDFKRFAEHLQNRIESNFEHAEKLASDTLSLLESMQIPNNAFDRASYPNFMQKAKENIRSVKIAESTQWVQKILTGVYDYYKKSTPTSEKQQIDSIKTELNNAFLGVKYNLDQNKVYALVLRELLPMALINLVEKERSSIQKEQNILLVADFNSLLHEQVKDQPAPFIYERLGERYRHFFIDEFQDTSQLQWENMLPLLDHVLSQNFDTGLPGSVMLVGDVKQSIYRWRGGNPEQFIGLTRETTPFQITPQQKHIIHLDTNYRSSENIIEFNNKFFTYVADILENEAYRELYKIGNQQKKNTKQGGYVHIEMLPKVAPGVTNNTLHQEKIVEIIQKLQQDETVSLSDICILVRKNKEGVLISEALEEHHIPLISSETLLLKNSREVHALLDSLRLLLFPADKEARVRLCYYLYNHLAVKEHKHDFLNKLIQQNKLQDFLDALALYDVKIDLKIIREAGLYQTFEQLIKSLKIEKHNNAYLFSFMEFAHQFEQTQATTKHLFFDYWERKADRLSIPSSKQSEAVQIMTIHKAKGLEFPIVIVPFANHKIGDLSMTSEWLPWQDAESGFEEVYLSVNNSLTNFSELYTEAYQKIYNTTVLDDLNTVYVAFTRASEELYIITDTYRNTKNAKPLSLELEGFVEKEGASLNPEEIYTFGERLSKVKVQQEEQESLIQPNYTLTDANLLEVVTAEADLWENKMQEAMLYGTQLHQVLEHIKTKEDVATYFDKLKKQQILSPEKQRSLFETVEAIVAHEELQHLFAIGSEVRTELDIATADKKILRMDRLNFHKDGRLTLVDYKTGEPKPQDLVQIHAYAEALEEMGMQLKEKILVYSNQNKLFINKV